MCLFVYVCVVCLFVYLCVCVRVFIVCVRVFIMCVCVCARVQSQSRTLLYRNGQSRTRDTSVTSGSKMIDSC